MFGHEVREFSNSQSEICEGHMKLAEFVLRNLDNIYSGMISSVILLCLQPMVLATTGAINFAFSVRARMTTLWAFAHASRIFIVSGSIADSNPEVRSVVLAGPDADAAASAVIATLGLLYPTCGIRHLYSNTFPIDLIKDDLCAIGGPVNNVVAAKLISTLPITLSFDDSLALHVGDDVFGTDLERGRPLRRRLPGMVIRMKNPFHPGSNCHVFYGV